MRALAQSVASERDAATSHILTLQRELESHRAALSALQEQAEGSQRAVRGGGGSEGVGELEYHRAALSALQEQAEGRQRAVRGLTPLVHAYSTVNDGFLDSPPLPLLLMARVSDDESLSQEYAIPTPQASDCVLTSARHSHPPHRPRPTSPSPPAVARL